jgi:D-alanine-D-alanine ligase
MEDDLRVLGEVFRILKPSGTLVLDITDGEYMRNHYDPRSWEWIDKRRLVCRERSISLDQQRLITREIVVHHSRGVVVDQFYAERLYSQEMLAQLLGKAGFVGMVTNLTFKGQSTRDQDLGMMGHRFLLTGKARKEWSQVRAPRSSQTRKITVIMGDPSLKDTLKPQEVFDDDDFYTIDQLKSALREIQPADYEFSYLNNHQTLINDLLTSRPELVLNLCDEGYRNDPRQELHITALLEMLGIPYSGGTPQCLAACYDKALVRGVARDLSVPVPAGFIVNPDESAFPFPDDFPVIVKPSMGDSSHGIYASNVVYNAGDYSNVIVKLQRAYRVPILVEEFLTGEDLTVGIIGNQPDDYKVFPLGMTDYSGLPDGLPPICGYESKWFPDSPYWTQLKFVPAILPEELVRKIVDWSLLLKDRFECHDYVRLDWRCNSTGEPRLLEINPNPGWCWDGHLNQMAKFDDISYRKMLRMIIRSAEARYQMVPLATGEST